MPTAGVADTDGAWSLGLPGLWVVGPAIRRSSRMGRLQMGLILLLRHRQHVTDDRVGCRHLDRLRQDEVAI